MYEENMDESGLDYIYICMNINVINVIYYDCNLPPGKQTWQFSTMFHGIIINNNWGIFHCRTRLLEGRSKDAIEINYINNQYHKSNIIVLGATYPTSSHPTYILGRWSCSFHHQLVQEQLRTTMVVCNKVI